MKERWIYLSIGAGAVVITSVISILVIFLGLPPDPVRVKAKFRQTLNSLSTKWGEPDWSNHAGPEYCGQDGTYRVIVSYRSGEETLYFRLFHIRGTPEFIVSVSHSLVYNGLGSVIAKVIVTSERSDITETGKSPPLSPQSKRTILSVANDLTFALREALR